MADPHARRKDFLHMLTCDEKMFASTYGEMQLHTLLGVEESAVNYDADNATLSLRSLRSIASSYEWVVFNDADAVQAIMDGKMACQFCRGKNATHGWMCASVTAAKRHERTDVHEINTKAARKKGVQLDLVQSGMEFVAEAEDRKRVRMLAVSSLVAGGDGAGGVPYSAIPHVLSPQVQKMVRYADGLPTAKTIRETDLPGMVTWVKHEIKKLITAQPISIGIDGGSSRLADCSKVIAMVATSPALPYDVLLDLKILDEHEDAEIQAEALESVRANYSVSLSDIKYVVADNASVNEATVAKLREKFNWTAEYTRCLPHSLNLVIVACCGEFDAVFKMASHLKDLRAFFNAGGSAARRAWLIEFGLTFSGIDFAETRWTSFIQAVKYMMGNQSDDELKRAAARLQRKADAGDQSAKEALLAPSLPRLRCPQAS